MPTAVPTGNYIRGILNGSLLGQTVQTVLTWWRIVDPAITATANDAAQAIYDDVWTATLKAMLHEAFTLDTIFVRMGAIAASSPATREATKVVSETGTVSATECLPPNVTVRILRSPSNEPVYSDDGSAPDFSKATYKLGFSGIPEGQQNAGLLVAAYETGWNAVGEALETLTVNSNDYSLMIARAPNTLVGGNQPAWTEVLETQVSQKLGTQNTRSLLS